MIIVEGPDGSGKSTLIQHLGFLPRKFKALRTGLGGTNSLGLHDGIFGWGHTDETVNAYYRVIDEYHGARRHENIAADRFHLSERVYSPILRGYQAVTDEDLATVSRTCRMQQIPIILCLPPFHVTLANVLVTGRERPSYQTEAFLREAYDAFVKLAPWATVVYDYTVDAPPVLA